MRNIAGLVVGVLGLSVDVGGMVSIDHGQVSGEGAVSAVRDSTDLDACILEVGYFDVVAILGRLIDYCLPIFSVPVKLVIVLTWCLTRPEYRSPPNRVEDGVEVGHSNIGDSRWHLESKFLAHYTI